MMDKEFKIFIDFDGTITTKDVGDSIFQEFADKEKIDLIIDDLLSDKISALECWQRSCELAENVSIEKVNDFIDRVEIDNTFLRFIEYCRKNNFEIFVLSDGFDLYINRIFEKHGISDVKVFCNRLSVINGRFVPEFPFLDETCRTSANCKINHIISNSSDDDYTFYIGDGNSDKHPAQFCDFIFAKKGLLKFCEKERVSFFPYNNFNDVMARLEELRQKKRLKKRHQAELKRRERYMIE